MKGFAAKATDINLPANNCLMEFKVSLTELTGSAGARSWPIICRHTVSHVHYIIARHKVNLGA